MHVYGCRVEYCTWAGMIVAQYGRFPGSHALNGVLYSSAQGGSPPRQSAALDQLQRYYGTGDTCSEPGDFKPGERLAAGPPKSAGCLRQQQSSSWDRAVPCCCQAASAAAVGPSASSALAQ